MVTVKVEKEEKVRSADAEGPGSSCPAKEQAAKGPVLGGSFHRGHASKALQSF